MRRLRFPIAILSGLLFLLAGGLGLHVHLCFDGSEPPASVRAVAGAHLDHQIGEVHEDLDLEPLDTLLAKSAKLDLPAVALFAVLLFLFAPPSASGLVLGPEPPAARAVPRRWRPPLRAPPR